MQPPGANDPRLPESLRGQLVGVFPGDTTTRAVFVVSGDQAGTLSFDDGAMTTVGLDAGAGTACSVTLLGLGLDEADLEQFRGGLAPSA